MITNAEIRQVKSLREKKFRESLGLFVVEGEKMVEEACASGYRIVNLWHITEIGEDAMARISTLNTPSPVLAVVRKPEGKVPESCGGLCLALDSVRDPGNMGTIMRICDWFGVGTLYLSPDCVEIYNPKVIQASMGSIFRVRTATVDIPSICREFRKKGLPVYGTFLDGADIYAQELEGEGLIVMGNESNGISPGTGAEVSSKLRIPSFGNSGAESLNVAVAAAVTLSEFRRR